MTNQINQSFQRNTLSPNPTVAELQKIEADYEAIILSNLQLVVNRYGLKPDYPWIDTKFSSITGEDFPENDYLRGPNTIYGWIQGRALESLSIHADWLRNYDTAGNFRHLLKRIDKILLELLQQIRKARKKNNGHLSFFLTPAGNTFTLDSENKRKEINLTSSSPFNFTDIFVAKGMYATANHLQDHEIRNEALQYCLDIFNAVFNNDFISDQSQLDHKNNVQHLHSRISHGQFMLQIGTAALLAKNEKNIESVDFGMDLIRHVLLNHINLDSRWSQLKEFDFVEFIDKNNNPYAENNKIVSDPGHSLEFVGLTLEFTKNIKQLTIISEKQRKEIDEIESLMPSILVHNFSNGFCENSGGICKTFDLISRKSINSDMPWWSLPETIRAALRCLDIAQTPTVKQQCLAILSKCHNSFVLYYVQPERHLLVVQTRNKHGESVDVIPATPDYDPGYHTGICLIKSLEILKTLHN